MPGRHGGLSGRHARCRGSPFIQGAFTRGGPRVAEDFEGFPHQIEGTGDEDEGIGNAGAEGFTDGLGGSDRTRNTGGETGFLEVVRGNGAGTGNRGGDDPGDERSEFTGHVTPGFIREHAEDEGGWAPLEMSLERGLQRLQPIAVVGAVEKEGALALPQDLKASGPLYRGKTPRQFVVGDRQDEAQHADGGGGEGGIGALMFPQQGEFESEPVHRQGIHMEKGGAHFTRLVFQDGDCVGIGRRRQGGDAGFEDAGLFSGNRGDGIPEHSHVIPTDLGDHGSERGDDVGGIESTPEAGLPDNDIDLVFQEPEQGDDGGELEEGRFDGWLGGLGKVPDPFNQTGEGDIGNGHAIDPDAFTEPDQVGRGIEPGTPTGGPVDGIEHGADRALAVGAGDVDEAEGILGITGKGGQTARGLQAGLESELAERVQIGQRFFVGHGADRSPAVPNCPMSAPASDHGEQGMAADLAGGFMAGYDL